MQTSESIAALAEALAKAQADMGSVAKDGINPHFRSRYASLASVLDAVRGPLAAQGLSVVQGAESGDDGVVVVSTRLLHASGEWIESKLSARPAKADTQGIGSCVTYLRRYSLMSICGVAPDDDDGNGSVETTTRPAKKREEDPLEPLNRAVSTGALTREQVRDFCGQHFGCDNPRELTPEHRTQLLGWVAAQVREAAA